MKIFFNQKEQQKTFINRIVENKIFLNTKYKRTIFFLDKIPVFSLNKEETDSIVYELRPYVKTSPQKNKYDWEGLAFKKKIGDTIYFYQQIGNTEDHKGRFRYNSASWLFCEVDYGSNTFLLGSYYLGDRLSDNIYEYMDEGYEEGIINILERNKWRPTRLISGKIKNNFINPDSCIIKKESLTWVYLPPPSIRFGNLTYALKRFFKREYVTHY